MAGTTTLTLRLDRTLKADLDRLAEETHRSKSYLAAQVIKDGSSWIPGWWRINVYQDVTRGLAPCRLPGSAGILPAFLQQDQRIDR
jgi:predicted transcriptional regulator